MKKILYITLCSSLIVSMATPSDNSLARSCSETVTREAGLDKSGNAIQVNRENSELFTPNNSGNSFEQSQRGGLARIGRTNAGLFEEEGEVMLHQVGSNAANSTSFVLDASDSRAIKFTDFNGRSIHVDDPSKNLSFMNDSFLRGMVERGDNAIREFDGAMKSNEDDMFTDQEDLHIAAIAAQRYQDEAQQDDKENVSVNIDQKQNEENIPGCFDCFKSCLAWICCRN